MLNRLNKAITLLGTHKLASRLIIARDDIVRTTNQTDLQIPNESNDALTLIKENSDILLLLYKGAKSNDDLVYKTKYLFDNVRALQNSLVTIGKELVDALDGPEDLKDLDDSGIAMLKESLTAESQNLSELLKISQSLKSIVDTVERTKASTVTHKLPAKNSKEKEQAKITPLKL